MKLTDDNEQLASISQCLTSNRNRGINVVLEGAGPEAVGSVAHGMGTRRSQPAIVSSLLILLRGWLLVGR